MTDDQTLENAANEEPRSRPLLAQVLIYVGISLAVGCTGALIGITAEAGLRLIPSLVVGAIILAGIGMTVYGVKIGGFDAPSLSSKTGRAQLILLASAGLGALIGFYLIITGTRDRFFDGDFTISKFEAIFALALLFIVVLPMAIIRERNADDFEKAAAHKAAYWAFSVYLYGFMAWSIAEAGGLLPPLNHGYFFIFLLFFFSGIWAYKRSG